MPKSYKRSAAQRKAWAHLSPWVKKKIRGSGHSKWARRCRREFQYQCSRCFKKRSLEAHHIFFKSLYPSMKEDMDNGVLVCNKCHDFIHTLYIESQEKYWELIRELVKKRIKMKSISKKNRNPSGIKYKYTIEFAVKLLEQVVEVVAPNSS